MVQDVGTTLARLLALDTRERISRGDLPGAWEDILAQFRMAHQLAAITPTLMQMLVAGEIHHRAVGLAIDWAGDPRQSTETIRKARDDLKRLPPLPSMAGGLRVESLILDRTFDLSAEELDRFLGPGSPTHAPAGSLIFTALIAPPWERTRARRIARRLVAEMLPEMDREPWQRSSGTNFDAFPEGSPLARQLFPACRSVVNALDRELVGRRALEQVAGPSGVADGPRRKVSGDAGGPRPRASSTGSRSTRTRASRSATSGPRGNPPSLPSSPKTRRVPAQAGLRSPPDPARPAHPL